MTQIRPSGNIIYQYSLICNTEYQILNNSNLNYRQYSLDLQYFPLIHKIYSYNTINYHKFWQWSQWPMLQYRSHTVDCRISNSRYIGRLWIMMEILEGKFYILMGCLGLGLDLWGECGCHCSREFSLYFVVGLRGCGVAFDYYCQL